MTEWPLNIKGQSKKLAKLNNCPKGRQGHHVFHLPHEIDMIKLLPVNLMNVRFNGTHFCFYLAYYLYAETDFCVHMIHNW